VAADTLSGALAAALAAADPRRLADLADLEPVDDHDAAIALLTVHDVHVGALRDVGPAVRLQHHPALAALKWRLDERFLDRLRRLDRSDGPRLTTRPDDAVSAMRAIAAIDRIPRVYEWLATEATLEGAVEYLSAEGGPDGGFDDLVAICQLGLDGEPKLEMARNYWDEMGNGSLARVHTELHRKLAGSLGLRHVPRAEQPLEALERSALGSLLATNRWLQPEMVGALGMIELQAGPRCRKVVAALERLEVGWDAVDFYAEHQEADPRHGKDWLDNVIAHLQDDPEWSERMVRGARWRSAVNHAFFGAMATRIGVRTAAVADVVAA
jgi:hypothetical protein